MSARPPGYAAWPRERQDEYFHSIARSKATSAPAKPIVELVAASTLVSAPIRWLWPGWLARGKIHVLAGAPGVGKTTLAMKMASVTSTGTSWPDGCISPAGNVIIWSGEDDPADTLKPKLVASGADVDHLFFVSDVREGEERRAFDPSKDMDALRAAIAKIGDVKLIIVDPVVSAVAGNSHKNSEVRRALQPLADLAGNVDAALIGITHFSKGSAGREPLERVVGSIAFGALARVVMVAVKENPDEDGLPPRRLLVRAKSNIGPDEGGFTYDLFQEPLADIPEIIASIARFGEPIQGTARQILAEAEAEPDEHSAKGDAEKFLSDFLAFEPKTVREIKTAAEAHGLAWRTIERAKKAVGVRTKKSDFNKGWLWELGEARQGTPTPKSWRPSSNLAAFEGRQKSPRPPKKDEDRQESVVGDAGGLGSGDDYEGVEF